MSYWALNAIFLSATAVVGVVAVVVAGRRHRPGWASVLIAAAVMLVMTVVFDNVMIGIGLVGYAPEKIGGVFVGLAPLEDFAYPIAAAVLLPSLWVLTAGVGRSGGAAR